MAATGGGGGSGAQQGALPSSSGGALFRAQCVGLVKSEGAVNANPVLNVLRGMCVRYETFERTELGLSAPLQSGTGAAPLRLFRHSQPAATAGGGANPFAPPPTQMWTLVHESAPLRGPLYAALPATVREVAESNIYGGDAPRFLEALGARVDYCVRKMGNFYVCNHHGLEIQVLVYTAQAQKRDGSYDTNLLGRDWLLEASADALPEKQVEVARLMGSFAERLLPHVELRKPAM